MRRFRLAVAFGAVLLVMVAVVWASWVIHPRFVPAACIATLALTAGLLFFEDRFVFRPSRRPVGQWEPQHPGAKESSFVTRDGLRLHAWWQPGSGDGAKRPVLLWCHGSTGNVTHRAEAARVLAAQGLPFLLFDYRGYGRSQGRPSERGLYMDGEAAYRHLVEQLGVHPARIVCYGQGLGSTVALHVALVRKAAGVILEGAQEDVAALVRGKLMLLPLTVFGRNRFDNAARIRKLKAPLLMAYGEHDERIPVERSRALFEAARQPKQFHVIQGAGHSDAFERGGADYCKLLRRFCDECVSSGAGGE